MKYYCHLYILSFLSIFTVSPFAGHAQSKLHGKVTDASNNDVLIGASVYLSDLKIGAITKEDGSYIISNVHPGTYVAEVRFLGYFHNYANY